MFSRRADPPKDSWADKPLGLMSYDELLAVRLRVDQEINTRGPGELEALKEKLSLIARAQGLSPADLFGESPKPERKERKKREVKIRYRNPDNPEETWTGIGKPKKWLKEKLDAGATLDDFIIA